MNRFLKWVAASSGILLGTSILASCALSTDGTGFGIGEDGGSGSDAGNDAGDSGKDAPPASICGNNAKEDLEACDGSDLSGQSCSTVPGGYNGGALKCKPDCSGFDTSDCTKPLTCGDTVCNGGETCSSCPDDCGVCPPLCGNGVIDPGELCDGANLAGKTCASEKGAGWTGVLSCTAECKVDNSACVPPCGNNIKEGTEVCDGSDLSGLDCTTIPKGFSGGTLKCKPDCSGYNTSMCLLPATCDAGAAGTVDNIIASGTTETGVLLHYALVADFYNAAATTKSFTGIKLPGQLVLAGKDGASFSLFNGVTAVAKTWYMVNMGDLPGAECGGAGGVNFPSQACLVKVAKSFRCQHSPYVESSGCPTPIGFTAQPAASTGSDSTPSPSTVGWRIMLVDLTCP